MRFLLLALLPMLLAAADLPRVHYADPNGRDTKDPSVVKFNGTYFLYYSQNQPDGTWRCAGAMSQNLLDWTPLGTLALKVPDGKAGCAAPGARVIDGKLHLFFQSYGGRGTDAIVHATSADGITFDQPAVRHVVHPNTGTWHNRRAIDAEAFAVGDKLFCYWATRDPTGKTQIVGHSTAPRDADPADPASWTHATEAGPTLAPRVPTALDDPKLDLAWEGACIEAPTMLAHEGHVYMVYAGGYNNAPQMIGVAVSRDGATFARQHAGQPILRPGPEGSWNASESGHPGAFVDDDGKAYLFYQGDNVKTGAKWRISMRPINFVDDPAGGPDLLTVE